MLELALAEPSRDSAHLLVLLRERLAWLQLPAPTLDLCLRADDITRRERRRTRSSFRPRAANAKASTQLIERLQARLGAEQVQRLQPVDDHRPECGSRIELASGGASSAGGGQGGFVAVAAGGGGPFSASEGVGLRRRYVQAAGRAAAPCAGAPA